MDRCNRWDNPETATGGSTAEKKLKYRGGIVYFEETGREVPYLLVPSGATHSGDEQKRLLTHMRKLFKLDETFFTTTGPCPPNVILRVTPGEDLSCPGVGGTHNLSVASPTRRSRSRRTQNNNSSSLDESVEVGREDQAMDCLSTAIGFVQEYKGCLITSADRTTGIDLLGHAIRRGGRNLRIHARADRCRPPVWWIGHHNLRHTEDEAAAIELHKDKGAEELLTECRRRRLLKDVDLSHLGLDEVSEREALVRFCTTL